MNNFHLKIYQYQLKQYLNYQMTEDLNQSQNQASRNEQLNGNYFNTQISQQNQFRKRSRPSIYTKSTIITFFKVGICHMCRIKNKLVYQCYKNYAMSACQKKYCLDCLLLIYKENIIDIIQKCDSWKCPFAKKVCRCKPCCLGRKQTQAALEVDPSQPVICFLKSKQKQGEDEEQEQEFDEILRCVFKEKFRKLIEFNGQLISKFNSNLHKLTEDETRFYNKIVHSNLKVLDKLSKNLLANNSIVDQ